MHRPAFLLHLAGELRSQRDRVRKFLSVCHMRLEQFRVWARQPGPDGEVELGEDGDPKPTSSFSELIRINMTGTWHRHYW
jgi:hypothetical protein